MNLKYCTKEELQKIILDPVLFSEHVLKMPCVSVTEEKILRSRAKRILLAAGRRWGKTTMLAIYSLWDALTEANGKGNIAVFTPSWEQSDIFMDAYREVISYVDPVVRKMFTITENKKSQVTLNDCQVFTRSATKTSRSIRGHGRNVKLLIRDEDAFIPDSMMKVIRPVRISKAAKELVTSTTAGHNHFYKDFNSKVYESYKVTSYDNKYLDKKEIDDEKELLTKSEFAQEYMAEFMDDRYSVFPQVLIDEATDFSKQFIESPSENIEYVMGVDLGRRRDATVIVIAHSELNHIYVDLALEIHYLQDGRYWHNVLKEIEAYIKRFKIRTVHVDQTGIGDKPTEDLRNTLLDQNILCNVKGVDFTRRLKNSKHGLINALLLKFERKEIHFPFCEKLIRQLKNIRFQASEAPSAAMGTYGIFASGGHDDFVAALMLALDALPDTQEIFYTRSNKSPLSESFPYQQDWPQLIVTNPDNF